MKYYCQLLFCHFGFHKVLSSYNTHTRTRTMKDLKGPTTVLYRLLVYKESDEREGFSKKPLIVCGSSSLNEQKPRDITVHLCVLDLGLYKLIRKRNRFRTPSTILGSQKESVGRKVMKTVRDQRAPKL